MLVLVGEICKVDCDSSRISLMGIPLSFALEISA